MNERIKQLRKELGYTQQEFADRIGVKRNTVAQYEIGRNEPIESVINLICKEYNVNPEWLRTGSGEMFIKKSKDEELAEFLADVQLEGEESFKHRLILGLSNMSETGWDELEKFLDSINKKD